MTKTSKPNGNLSELTPDAIRTDGTNAAEHVRALGQKCFLEGEDVAAFAEEIANTISEATTLLADRVAATMATFQAARESMKQHQAAIAAIPDPLRKALPEPSPQADIDAMGLNAVGKATAADTL